MELELVSTEDLINELMNRCTCGAITLFFAETEDNAHDARAIKGNPWMVVGLLEQTKLFALGEIDEGAEDLSEED